MKKRVFAIAIALCMVIAIFPVTAFAAYVNAGTAEALQKQLEAGGEVKLTANVTGDFTVPAGKTVILNLNGKTITNSTGHTITVENGAALTITGSGTVDNITHAKAAIYNDAGGNVTLNGGIYTRSREASTSAEDSGENSFYTLKNFGTMIINAGVTVNQGADGNGKYSSLVANGWQSGGTAGQPGKEPAVQNGGARMTINGGTFNGGLNTIKNDDYGTLTINGGVFQNVAQAVFLNWNVATVNGGSFTSDKYGILNGGGDETMDQGDLTINGGTFNSAQPVISAMNGNSDYLENVKISGGTFSSDVSRFLGEGYANTVISDRNVVTVTQENLAVAQVGDNRFTTLQNALDAARSGDTVTLLREAETPTGTAAAVPVTLDLNGNTLRIVNVPNSTSAIGLRFAGEGGNVLKNGTVLDTRSYQNTACGFVTVYLNGAASLTTADVKIQAYKPNSAANYNYLLREDAAGDKNPGVTLNAGTELTELENDGSYTGVSYGAVGVSVFGSVASADAEAVVSGAALTVNDGVTIDTTGFAISGNGSSHGTSITVNGGTLTSKSTAIYHPQRGTLTITGGTITGGTGIEIRAGILNVSGSAVIGGTDTPVSTAPNGNGTTSDGAGIAVSQHTTMLPIQVNISGGTITGYSAFYQVNTLKDMKDGSGNPKFTQEELEAALAKVSLGIEGGSFRAVNGGTVAVYSEDFTRADGEGFITGGLFSSDPSAYVNAGKAAVPTTQDGYHFTIGEVRPEVKVADGKVVPQEPTGNYADEAVSKEAAAEAAGTVSTVLSGAAGTIAGEADSSTVENASAALADANISIPDGEELIVLVQPYLKVTPTGSTVTEEEKTLSFEIQPRYNLIATTSDVDVSEPDQIITETSGEQPQNAVLLETGDLTVTTPTAVALTLPSGFAEEGASVYIRHEASSGTYYYTAVVEEDSRISFTTQNGFSPFTISTANGAVAEVNGVGYASFQEAVNAVEDGGTIRVLQDVESTVSGSKTFTVEVADGKTVDLTAASGYNLSQDGATYTVSRRSSGVSSYTVRIDAAENGSVTASPKTAAAGRTVTLTVTPGTGYVLSGITVTDESGREVSVEKAGQTTYTFVMPAADVTVKASFGQGDHDCPAAQFTDVNLEAWYHEAVDYVLTAGLMNGMSDTIFAPDSQLTRGMLVTVLYRLEGEPAVAGTAFADVAADAYYAKAVTWASANGIVKGYGGDVFGPEDDITREQLATILCRYAAYKGCDVSGRADLSGFTDAAQISDYAAETLAWANAAGLINGMGDKTLAPQSGATRAQVAAILMRFCENIAK